MENINGLDLVIVCVVAISGLFAFCRGFLSEMLGIGSWIVAGTGGVYLLPYVSPLTENFIRNGTLANIAAGVLSSLILLVVLTLVCSFLTGKIRQSSLNRLDRFLGLIFGFLRGFIILMLMYFILFVLSPKTLEDLGRDSKLYPFLDDVCLRVKEHMPESLFDNPSDKSGKSKDSEELEGLLKSIGKNEIEIAAQEVKDLPENDPLRQMVEEHVKENGSSGFFSFFEKFTGGDKDAKNKKSARKKKAEKTEKRDAVKKKNGDDDLFDKLNGVQVESKNKKGGDIVYGEKDKEDLNRLILENIEEAPQ